MKICQGSEWEPVQFDPDTITEGLENLVAFEKLSNYSLLNDDNAEVNVKKVSKKRKKSQKKITESDQVTINSNKRCKFTVTENAQSVSTPSKEDHFPWANIFVPEEVSRSLLEEGFSAPTEIQKLCIPAAIKGRRDLLGAAETGSGKTLAFGIPVIYGIMKNLEKISGNHETSLSLWALILTPTRELAVQIKKHLEIAAKYTPVKIELIVGGLSVEKQTRLLNREPHIVVATPGRLWDLIKMGHSYLKDIHRLRFLVVDETDRMLEKNHFPELQSLLERINANESDKKLRQNFVFSATLTFTHQPPNYIKKKKWRKKVSDLTLTSKQKLDSIIKLLGITDPKIVDITTQTGTAEKLEESRIFCLHREKDYYLYYFLLVHPGKTLVFCNSIDCVKRLTSIISLLKITPLPLHSSMIQKQRLKNLERFSSGKGVLIATDIAARGLDIPDMDHVIHYQVPRTCEAYVHRSGRTARGQRHGLTVVLVSPEEASLYTKTLLSLGRKEEPCEFPIESDVLHQVKQRVDIAHSIDIMLLSNRRKSEKKTWLERAADEADLIIDEDVFKIPVTDFEEEAKKKKALKIARSQLDNLLSKPVPILAHSAVAKVSSDNHKSRVKFLKKPKNR